MSRHLSSAPPFPSQEWEEQMCRDYPNGPLAGSFAVSAKHRKPGPPSTPADAIVAAADLGGAA